MFIPGNVFVYYYSKKFNKSFTFYLNTIAIESYVGNLNGILSRASCLWKSR